MNKTGSQVRAELRAGTFRSEDHFNSIDELLEFLHSTRSVCGYESMELSTSEPSWDFSTCNDSARE